MNKDKKEIERLNKIVFEGATRIKQLFVALEKYQDEVRRLEKILHYERGEEMKQLFFVLQGRDDKYFLVGIYGNKEEAIKAARGFGEDNAHALKAKIYSGNFGIVEIGKETKDKKNG